MKWAATSVYHVMYPRFAVIPSVNLISSLPKHLSFLASAKPQTSTNWQGRKWNLNADFLQGFYQSRLPRGFDWIKRCMEPSELSWFSKVSTWFILHAFCALIGNWADPGNQRVMDNRKKLLCCGIEGFAFFITFPILFHSSHRSASPAAWPPRLFQDVADASLRQVFVERCASKVPPDQRNLPATKLCPNPIHEFISSPFVHVIFTWLEALW